MNFNKRVEDTTKIFDARWKLITMTMFKDYVKEIG